MAKLQVIFLLITFASFSNQWWGKNIHVMIERILQPCEQNAEGNVEAEANNQKVNKLNASPLNESVITDPETTITTTTITDPETTTTATTITEGTTTITTTITDPETTTTATTITEATTTTATTITEATTTITTTIPTTTVVPGYKTYPGIGTYKFYEEPKTWEEARLQCIDDGAHLAILNSKAEQNLLTGIFNQAKRDRKYFHSGFHSLFANKTFITIFDDPIEKTGFANWTPGEPNDPTGEKERCGSIYQEGGINDGPCTVSLLYFCEVKPC